MTYISKQVDQQVDSLFFNKAILNACHRVSFRKYFLWQSAEDELRCLTAWGEKLLCSLVVQEQILLRCQAAAEQLAYNETFYVGFATELYLSVDLL